MKRLNELFDNPYKYRTLRDDMKYAVYKFDSDNGNEMTVRMAREEMLEPQDKDVHLYNISFTSSANTFGNQDDMTHAGDQFRIMATVISIIKKFYKKKGVGGVIVGTKPMETLGDNIAARKKIYFALVKKLSQGQTVTRDIKSYPDSKIILKKGVSLGRNFDPTQMWKPLRPR